jgi:hypothetical protein
MSDLLVTSARNAVIDPAKLGSCLVELGLPATGDVHDGAFFETPLGGAEAEARAAACDECNPSLQI